MNTTSGPITSSIETKLTEAFKPIHLDIINESYMHNVPKGSETHFKVLTLCWKRNKHIALFLGLCGILKIDI